MYNEFLMLQNSEKRENQPGNSINKQRDGEQPTSSQYFVCLPNKLIQVLQDDIFPSEKYILEHG